jgi:hypothetical protein
MTATEPTRSENRRHRQVLGLISLPLLAPRCVIAAVDILLDIWSIGPYYPTLESIAISSFTPGVGGGMNRVMRVRSALFSRHTWSTYVGAAFAVLLTVALEAFSFTAVSAATTPKRVAP